MTVRRIHAILPVYNEGRSVYSLLARYARLASLYNVYVRAIVVDDCSQDDSPKWISKAIIDFTSITIVPISHQTNQGLGGAFNTGFTQLGDVDDDDVVVTMDGDDTHNPMLIKAMIDKIDEGADMVIASRYCEQSRISGLTLSRIVLSHLARILYSARWNIPGVRDYTCGFRAYRGDIAKEFVRLHGPVFLRENSFACAGELLHKMAALTKVIVEVPMILRYANKENPSNLKVLRTIRRTLGMLVRS